jgi:hypothetical protein
MKISCMALGLLAAPEAFAFCGMYVGPVGSAVENGASRIVVAHNYGTTTLTMANDATSDASEFAMLIPVPSVLGQHDVRVVDRSYIDRLEEYTAPRVVAYTCDDLYPTYGSDSYYGSGDGESGGGCNGLSCGAGDRSYASSDTAMAMASSYGGGLTEEQQEALDSVDVHASFAVGSYEVVILSAEESLGLTLWLDMEGYAAPEGGEELLQDYLDAGTYFFAVKVNLEAPPEGEYLDPIQIEYPSQGDTWYLPTRLGALNASGTQEVVLFAIDSSGSQTFAQNLPEVVAEDECMPVLESEETLEGFHNRWLDDQFALEPTGGWMTEYGWPLQQKCDPCPPEVQDTLDPVVLGALGSDGGGYLSRLRIRYDAAMATDVMLSSVGSSTTEQIRFIQHQDYLEEAFPLCLGLEADNPGSCDDEQPAAVRAPPVPLRRNIGGHAGLFGTLMLLGAGVWRRRRRADR